MPSIEIKVEAWGDFWRDAEGLLREEYEEHKDLLDLWKPHLPDFEALTEMARRAALVILVARVNGAMAGYLWWTLDVDVESKGHVIYRQGPLYVAKRFAKHGLGVKMLRLSLRRIEASISAPVELDLHHPPVGRGLRLDSLFRRLGAREVARHYRLKVEPKAQKGSSDA